MTVDYDGACWLADFNAVDGLAQAERLDTAEVGFLMCHDGGRVVILANTPLANARALTGALVDDVGAELITRGASLCGPWAVDPPEPWGTDFGLLEDLA